MPPKACSSIYNTHSVWRERNSRRHHGDPFSKSQMVRFIDKTIGNRISLFSTGSQPSIATWCNDGLQGLFLHKFSVLCFLFENCIQFLKEYTSIACIFFLLIINLTIQPKKNTIIQAMCFMIESKDL